MFEGANHLGGLADAWKIGDITWDRFYHMSLASDQHLRALLAELDLERDFQWVETKTGFYSDGKLYSVSSSVEFLLFPPLRLIDRLRLGMTIWYASKIKNWKRLEAIPVIDWLRRLSGQRTLEKLWLPLLRAKLGDNCYKASAAFIWTTIARLYRARRSGLKKEMFGYVTGGYSRIVERFTEQLTEDGVTLRVGEGIERVEEDADGTVVIQTAAGQREHFDRVVLTMPAPLVMRVCPRSFGR